MNCPMSLHTMYTNPLNIRAYVNQWLSASEPCNQPVFEATTILNVERVEFHLIGADAEQPAEEDVTK
jgi:hypothetical protein